MFSINSPMVSGNIVASDYSALPAPIDSGLSASPLSTSQINRLASGSDTYSFSNRNRQFGSRQRNLMQGQSRADWLYGRAGNDTLKGLAGDDKLYGEQGNDRLWGGIGNDILHGGSGSNVLYGEAGHDQLLGGRDADQLVGGVGNDILNGGGGRNRATGGAGRDRFILASTGVTEITDFKDGEDALQLGADLKFETLTLIQGTGAQTGNTIIQNKQTGETLAILRAVNSDLLTATDFGIAPVPNPTPNPTPIPTPSPTPTPIPVVLPATAAIQASTIKFSANDAEATIAATGAARIQMGTQTLYVGTQQVSSDNQNPVIVSFDASDPTRNWVRTDYEVTGTDGRGYGLFWSGSQLYGVFSVDGTQGTPEQDFRRVSANATQAWLKSYGAGGGAKVAVLARLDPATGEMTDAVYISAINSGKSNSLAVNGLSVNAAGNLVMSAKSYFAPRRPDGKAMTQTTPGGSPFDYTLEITPDLKTVVSTAAVGWS